MSLTVDGVWKSGVWAFTVWGSGVWAEGGVIPPPPVVAPAGPIGGGYVHERRRGRKELREARRRVGLEDDYRTEEELAQAIVASVAARQALVLEQDEQKRFEELSRQLQLARIEFRATHLEALNRERQKLIDLEIGRLLRRNLQDEEILLMLLVMAAASA